MENNVPQEKWLYPDRCMKKWLGWILSDHSAYMEKASISEPLATSLKMPGKMQKS